MATATGAALFDMECTVFMGEEDMERQALNVFRMEMLGTKVECVKSGSRTLKDATNEAIRTWAKNAEDTFYIIGRPSSISTDGKGIPESYQRRDKETDS